MRRWLAEFRCDISNALSGNRQCRNGRLYRPNSLSINFCGSQLAPQTLRHMANPQHSCCSALSL